jgi:hypothetical protein
MPQSLLHLSERRLLHVLSRFDIPGCLLGYQLAPGTLSSFAQNEPANATSHLLLASPVGRLSFKEDSEKRDNCTYFSLFTKFRTVTMESRAG